MKININTKELIKGLLVICSYFLLTIILQIPFIFLYQLKLINEEILYILLYLSLSIVFILYYKKDIINNYNDFKKNLKCRSSQCGSVVNEDTGSIPGLTHNVIIFIYYKLPTYSYKYYKSRK